MKTKPARPQKSATPTEIPAVPTAGRIFRDNHRRRADGRTDSAFRRPRDLPGADADGGGDAARAAMAALNTMEDAADPPKIEEIGGRCSIR